MARARRIPAFLDTYGPPLDGIWGFWPEAIQLNRREAGLHLRTPEPGDAELTGLLRRWVGPRRPLGGGHRRPRPRPRPDRRPVLRAQPAEVDVVNPIGSGDCLLAGLVDARLRGLGPEMTLRHALGCASANARVWDAGAIDPATAAGDAEAVQIEAL